MYNREKIILDELLSEPSIKSVEIEKKHNLTKRQLGYSFKKINDWLTSQNLLTIERSKNGHFIIDYKILKELKYQDSSLPKDMNILSQNQRMYIILLMILVQEDISLFHFTNELDVSENTILNDLKNSKDYIADYGLSIRYSRKKGYLLEGKEFQIRKLLINIIYKIINMYNGRKKICELANISKEEIDELKNRVNKIEKELKLKFTDEKISTMPYILFLILTRASKGFEINPFYIKYEELSNTKEYLATEKLLYNSPNISMQEKLFVTLFLLTTNVQWSESIKDDITSNLLNALDDMILLFEKRACVSFQDREQLLYKLLLHAEPAYFRIKYNLTDINNTNLTSSEEFKNLHHLIKQSIGPLVDLIEVELPENEITYFTMLISGWLSKQGTSIQEKTKAIVVCPQGISVSRLLFGELKSLFPELIFLDTLSIREFDNYSLNYDIVFSSVPITTNKKQYTVNTFMTKVEKTTLRKLVFFETQGYSHEKIDAESILNIVENHAFIENKSLLLSELKQYLNQNNNEFIQVTHTDFSITDLIHQENITLKKNVSSWEDAIKIASIPLVKNGNITEDYIEAMIKHNKNPYIIISPNTAIPHASPSEGVNKLAMSLLRLEKSVNFSGEPINLIIVIAAIDKEKHIKPLTQLLKITERKETREKLIQANTKKEIENIIQQFKFNKESI